MALTLAERKELESHKAKLKAELEAEKNVRKEAQIRDKNLQRLDSINRKNLAAFQTQKVREIQANQRAAIRLQSQAQSLQIREFNKQQQAYARLQNQALKTQQREAAKLQKYQLKQQGLDEYGNQTKQSQINNLGFMQEFGAALTGGLLAAGRGGAASTFFTGAEHTYNTNFHQSPTGGYKVKALKPPKPPKAPTQKELKANQSLMAEIGAQFTGALTSLGRGGAAGVIGAQSGSLDLSHPNVKERIAKPPKAPKAPTIKGSKDPKPPYNPDRADIARNITTSTDRILHATEEYDRKAKDGSFSDDELKQADAKVKKARTDLREYIDNPATGGKVQSTLLDNPDMLSNPKHKQILDNTLTRLGEEKYGKNKKPHLKQKPGSIVKESKGTDYWSAKSQRESFERMTDVDKLWYGSQTVNQIKDADTFTSLSVDQSSVFTGALAALGRGGLGATVAAGLPEITEYTHRFRDIDAPEKGQRGGQAAGDYLTDYIGGKTVGIKSSGVQKNPNYLSGRMISDVTFGSDNVAEKLVSEGHAWNYDTYSQNPKLKTLQKEAQQAKKGLWSEPDVISPGQFRHGDATTKAKYSEADYKPKPIEVDPPQISLPGNVGSKSGRHFKTLPKDQPEEMPAPQNQGFLESLVPTLGKGVSQVAKIGTFGLLDAANNIEAKERLGKAVGEITTFAAQVGEATQLTGDRELDSIERKKEVVSRQLKDVSKLSKERADELGLAYTDLSKQATLQRQSPEQKAYRKELSERTKNYKSILKALGYEIPELRGDFDDQGRQRSFDTQPSRAGAHFDSWTDEEQYNYVQHALANKGLKAEADAFDRLNPIQQGLRNVSSGIHKAAGWLGTGLEGAITKPIGGLFGVKIPDTGIGAAVASIPASVISGPVDLYSMGVDTSFKSFGQKTDDNSSEDFQGRIANMVPLAQTFAWAMEKDKERNKTNLKGAGLANLVYNPPDFQPEDISRIAMGGLEGFFLGQGGIRGNAKTYSKPKPKGPIISIEQINKPPPPTAKATNIVDAQWTPKAPPGQKVLGYEPKLLVDPFEQMRIDLSQKVKGMAPPKAKQANFDPFNALDNDLKSIWEPSYSNIHKQYELQPFSNLPSDPPHFTSILNNKSQILRDLDNKFKGSIESTIKPTTPQAMPGFKAKPIYDPIANIRAEKQRIRSAKTIQGTAQQWGAGIDPSPTVKMRYSEPTPAPKNNYSQIAPTQQQLPPINYTGQYDYTAGGKLPRPQKPSVLGATVEKQFDYHDIIEDAPKKASGQTVLKGNEPRTVLTDDGWTYHTDYETRSYEKSHQEQPLLDLDKPNEFKINDNPFRTKKEIAWDEYQLAHGNTLPKRLTQADIDLRKKWDEILAEHEIQSTDPNSPYPAEYGQSQIDPFAYDDGPRPFSPERAKLKERQKRAAQGPELINTDPIGFGESPPANYFRPTPEPTSAQTLSYLRKLWTKTKDPKMRASIEARAAEIKAIYDPLAVSKPGGAFDPAMSGTRLNPLGPKSVVLKGGTAGAGPAQTPSTIFVNSQGVASFPAQNNSFAASFGRQPGNFGGPYPTGTQPSPGPWKNPGPPPSKGGGSGGKGGGSKKQPWSIDDEPEVNAFDRFLQGRGFQTFSNIADTLQVADAITRRGRDPEGFWDIGPSALRKNTLSDYIFEGIQALSVGFGIAAGTKLYNKARGPARRRAEAIKAQSDYKAAVSSKASAYELAKLRNEALKATYVAQHGPVPKPLTGSQRASAIGFPVANILFAAQSANEIAKAATLTEKEKILERKKRAKEAKEKEKKAKEAPWQLFPGFRLPGF